MSSSRAKGLKNSAFYPQSEFMFHMILLAKCDHFPNSIIRFVLLMATICSLWGSNCLYIMFRLTWCFNGREVAQITSCRPRAASSWVRDPSIPCGFCGEKSGYATCVSLSTAVSHVSTFPPKLHTPLHLQIISQQGKWVKSLDLRTKKKSSFGNWGMSKKKSTFAFPSWCFK